MSLWPIPRRIFGFYGSLVRELKGDYKYNCGTFRLQE
jgi:hypothetical protein